MTVPDTSDPLSLLSSFRRSDELADPREDPLWGAETERARRNFRITNRPVGGLRDLVWALGTIKLAAARANEQAGLLTPVQSRAIQQASREVMDGLLDEQFVVDRIQGGAGTSTNMNANEVIANRARQFGARATGISTDDIEDLDPIDHVNRSQSTNDTYPTAVKLGLYRAIDRFLTEHGLLVDSFQAKAREFAGILKIGRTQLQDAVPMTLGQEFAAFAETLREDTDRLAEAREHLLYVNLGATAIGTGINAPARYRDTVVAELAEITGYQLTPAANLVEATSDAGVFLLLSGSLKRAAVKLSKVANDLRLLSSGPQTGFGEIQLPAVQAGSSIMPGKVNPVIPEMVNQVAFRVIGADTTVTMAVEAGQLQLNAFEPIMADALFDSVDFLANACTALRTLCVEGITAQEERLRERMDTSLSVVTALTPYLGYGAAAELVKEALLTHRRLPDLVTERGLLDETTLADALDPMRLAGDTTIA
jgi:aspartate ammonia-lyase